ncbi:sensor histidine kinase response regulator, HAMP domain-containing [Citrifermentans bemidjiense Bem]|uniref:histidine kinase n=1 Tax=Citrifermentans bemidjiense (strain ATCC BAA-1014 / DSM 16622 / JCM 12645 / Bem) TaxID=404380 RepID=B5EHI8_CITBB|nr:ATP-binding protein [Citrifermentans bemidjiense]ACH38198.1 sensor histidine kinase response regulator, HAMP domain-containing [Citrifermentans bemidjiense Bem]
MILPQKLSTFRSSFQFKLLLRFTLFAAAITVLCVTLFVIYQIKEDKRHVSEQLRLEARTLASSIRLPLYAENMELLDWYARETLRLPGIRCVEIVGGNGKLQVRVPALPPAGEELIVEGAQVRTLPLHLSQDQSLEAAAGDRIGEVRLYRGTDDLWQAGRRLAWYSCLLAFGCWLLVSFSCYLLLRRVTASFNSLMRGLKNVHGGDYVSRIAVTSDDEPGRASASVNELAESLRQREQENRRLHKELLASMDFEIASKRQLVSINADLEKEIAERSRARQELKNLVEQLPLGIIWSDDDGAIEYLNAFVAQRIGYRDARNVDEWLSRVCPDPCYRDRVAAQRRAAIAGWERDNQVTFYEVKAVCSDGSQRQLNCSNQRSGSRTVDIVIDLTDRELLQQQIVRNQKLESIGVLAGGVAHNFNNALTGVLGYISFAKKYLDQSHAAHPLLLHAEKATLRAAGFANQLLSFAKGGAPLRKAVPVARIVEESVQLATSGSNVTAAVELPADLPPVYVDDGQMRQAFNCICINAVQAMPDGGMLTVTGRSVASAHEGLPAPLCGSYVELSFRDQGCGIRDEDKSNIFTPYFTTKAELGTGLGLATVHSIITRHDGAITFDTALGRGTTFTLYLPVFSTEAQPQPQPAKPLTAAAILGRGVLVMDDEEMIRNLAIQVLSSQGYRVTVCANGEEAAALYGEAYRSGTPFLAAILDLTVASGSGGKEAARQILAIDPQARLIVSSGYSNDIVMNRYRDYGFCAASPKPYDAHELFRLLKELAAQG